MAVSCVMPFEGHRSVKQKSQRYSLPRFYGCIFIIMCRLRLSVDCIICNFTVIGMNFMSVVESLEFGQWQLFTANIVGCGTTCKQMHARTPTHTQVRIHTQMVYFLCATPKEIRLAGQEMWYYLMFSQFLAECLIQYN